MVSFGTFFATSTESIPACTYEKKKTIHTGISHYLPSAGYTGLRPVL
jgi:hypothetical protein